MKAIFQTLVLWLLLAFVGNIHAQSPATNDSHFQLLSVDTSTNTLSARQDEIIPQIRFSDVPITTAVENLARLAAINYILDPRCRDAFTGSKISGISRPLVTLRWTNLTARAALIRLLDHHGFTLIENPVTRVALITSQRTTGNQLDVHLLGMNTNGPVYDTNDLIPIIQFSEVPLDVALENLIKVSKADVKIDPRLVSNNTRLLESSNVTLLKLSVDQTHKFYRQWFDPMPILSIRWSNLTARQALVALCNNYGLTIVKDGATGEVRVEPKVPKRHHHLRLR